MSRVFVSCSYRDRAVGDRLGTIVRAVGARAPRRPGRGQGRSPGGTRWSAGSSRATSCWLWSHRRTSKRRRACFSAKHGAAAGLRFVRLDLGDEEVRGCHPAVAVAHPGALRARWRPLGRGSARTRPGRASGAAVDRRRVPRRTTAPRALLADLPWSPSPLSRWSRGVWSRPCCSATTARTAAPIRWRRQRCRRDCVATPAPAPAPAPDAAGAQAVLAAISTAGSLGLPPSACQAGDRDVTCRNPARHLRTVVLTSYPTRLGLYDAYAAAGGGVFGRAGARERRRLHPEADAGRGGMKPRPGAPPRHHR